MKRSKKLEVGDYVKTNFSTDRNITEIWRGKIRRLDECSALIEWSYCGGLPTDICTHVLLPELTLTKKASKKGGKNVNS